MNYQYIYTRVKQVQTQSVIHVCSKVFLDLTIQALKGIFLGNFFPLTTLVTPALIHPTRNL